MRSKLVEKALRGVVYSLLILTTAITLVPIVWLLAASLKGPDDLFHYTFFAPLSTLSNFRDLFHTMPFGRYIINSVFYSATTVVVQLFFSSLGGFALAKYEFAGKRLLITIMLTTMVIPGQIMMAPVYEMIYRMGLVDSYLGLIVPGAVSVFGIFLFRQSIMQVPDEMLQAGRIDGCSEFRLYWNLVMPVSRPMTGAFCLISFMGTWNSFLWPQIILHTEQRFTLTIALTQLVGAYSQQYGILMAGTVLSVLPIALMFILLQREFIAGLTAGAVKG